LTAPDTNVVGFHLVTFNELRLTQAWRKAWLERLEQPQPDQAGITQ
jgi:hypothetical protein